MPELDDLLTYIFDGKKTAFYREFESWVRGLRRYKQFAIAYRGKIRTKLKNVRDDAGMKDLRAELETAAILLREDRFTLEYEKYAASRQRGTDFTVTFKTHTPFNVEVRRVRNVEMDDTDSDSRTTKLIAVIMDKVGQMTPNMLNLLWLTGERQITETDLTQAAVTLRQLAERKVEDFFRRRGFEDAVDFLHQYHHLSGVILHQSGEVWQNPLAKHKIPPEIVNAIKRLNQS